MGRFLMDHVFVRAEGEGAQLLVGPEPEEGDACICPASTFANCTLRIPGVASGCSSTSSPELVGAPISLRFLRRKCFRGKKIA